MRMTRSRVWFVALALAVCASAVGRAQLRGIKADTTPLLDSDGARAGAGVRAALQVKLPEGFHVQSNRPRDESLIPTVLTVDAPSGVSVEEIVFPPSTDLKQAGVEQPLAVFEREFMIGVRFAVGKNVTTGDVTVPARLRYQACDQTMCYAPATAQVSWTLHVVPATAKVTSLHADLFDRIAFGHGDPSTSLRVAPSDQSRGDRALSTQSLIPNPQSLVSNPQSPIPNPSAIAALDDFTLAGATGGYLSPSEFLTFVHNAEAGVKERGMFEGRGPLAILLLVFIGGLALNLTPCVLPMIPINLAIIGAGAQAGSRARGFLLGATYGLAMAVVYGVLGLVVILTAGTFGTINSSPWFNVGIAVLFVALGLAMFDVFEIDFSGLSSRFNPGAGRGSFLLAFSMGAVAALLAGACVAPVVIQVVLFSSNLYATGTKLALALPFCLGIGMALPWPVAGAGLAALPKPGLWMVRVKQLFGVIILGTALYYGYVAYELFSNRWVDAGAVASSVQEKLESGWHASLADGLAQARRENKPVLIDMWATWCKNCLTMDKTTFEDPSVNAALAGYVKIKFQAETPDQPPASLVMKRFDAVGLPTYVILKPRN